MRHDTYLQLLFALLRPEFHRSVTLFSFRLRLCNRETSSAAWPWLSPSSAAALHPAQQLLLDPQGLSWQAFLARTRGAGTLVSVEPLTSSTPKHSIICIRVPKMNKLYIRAKLMVTFFSILEPFNKLLHLLQKNTLSFCKMGIFIPLEDGFFTQNFSCKDGQEQC